MSLPLSNHSNCTVCHRCYLALLKGLLALVLVTFPGNIINGAELPVSSPPSQSPICLPRDGEALPQGAVSYESICVGWSEKENKALCIVGDHGWQQQASWSFTSLPEGLFGDKDGPLCVSKNIGPKPFFVLYGDDLKRVQKIMQDKQVKPLPSPLAKLTPRNTVDIHIDQNKKIRIRWNQFITSTIDTEQGSWHVYRERISLQCKRESPKYFISSQTPTFKILSNAKVSSLPKKDKFFEQDLYQSEGPSRSAEATIYALSDNRYLLLDISVPYAMEGDYGRKQAAVLIDIPRCHVDGANNDN